MLFNSIEFAIFLPIVFVLYRLAKNKYRWLVLLIASYVFYGSWKLEYLLLIIGSTLVDYFVGLSIPNAGSSRKKKGLLLVSITINLSVLILFKYSGFIINDVLLLDINKQTLSFLSSIVLPVGISFYTFQSMSYTIDIYNGQLKPTKHLGFFSLYVSFFPQLVAGPIERAGNLISQLIKPRGVSRADFYFAFTRISIGLIKKVVIADRIAPIVNEIYASNTLGGFEYLLGTILFSAQIYCDFSGYSSIAIGVARLFGVRLMENFRSPYFSKSLREFWSRWHISLSTWFRDYVYIPLGGSKTIKWKMYYNLVITFLISGLWHGASWTFIVWGGIHGLWLIVERYFGFKDSKSTFSWFLTLLIVTISWVFFRSSSIQQSWIIIGEIFSFNYSLPVADIKNLYFGLPLWKFCGTLLLLILLLLVDYFSIHYVNFYKRALRNKFYFWGFVCLYLISIIVFGSFEKNEFIYFQF